MLSVSEGGDFSLEAHESWSFFFLHAAEQTEKTDLISIFHLASTS